ncbi:MAG: hypothetical protein PHU64_00905 [Candidatus Omnitrophica bacterium]|nr:hypothetical protein [Candidatus Omnitrophota bacterium]MDD5430315.1 hypothetical protein [Candidatus Omnitrophota bacterium]
MDKIAKVALPIALGKEFDYLYPQDLRLTEGMRVLVDFNGKKVIGVVAGMVLTSTIKKLKSIIKVLDEEAVLSKEHIRLARNLSEFYPYEPAEFIFMMLPAYLRKTRKAQITAGIKEPVIGLKREKLFVKGVSFPERYNAWKIKVEEGLKTGSVLICFPQISYLLKAKEILERDFPASIKVLHSRQREKDFFLSWNESRRRALILGVRAAVFHYPADLRLVVVEQENSPYYFQEEKPFYHLRDVAGMLCDLKKVSLVLSGDYPSLEAYRDIKENKMKIEEADSQEREINIMGLPDFNKNKIIGPVLTEVIRKAVQEKNKLVIIWNKKGFARIIYCSDCGHIFTCGHCSGYLQTSLKEDEASCPYCQRRVKLESICSYCRRGYLKRGGFGIERLRETLKKFFPELCIDDWQNRSQKSQVVLATAQVLSSLYEPPVFETGCVLDTDHMLSRTDYEATFDTFLYLKKLLALFSRQLYVFTHNRKHYLFRYLNSKWKDFYEVELGLREKFGLAPFGLIAKITLRSKSENNLLKKTQELYNILAEKFTQVYGPFKEEPFKLRDKYRYSLVIKAERNSCSRKAIKKEIVSFRASSVKMAVTFR